MSIKLLELAGDHTEYNIHYLFQVQKYLIGIDMKNGIEFLHFKPHVVLALVKL